MGKRLKHEKRCQVLTTEREEHPPSRQAGLADQWDSAESDTESLARERAHQQQLHMCHGRHDQNKYALPQKENADSLLDGDGDGDDEDANGDEAEALHVYDSLEVAADHARAKRNPTPLQSEYLSTQTNESERTSQPLSDDAYSDLRYDPNWRTNLKGALEEHCQIPKEKCSQTRGDRQGTLMKGGYRYIVDKRPAAVVNPHMAASESDQPYRLHPQDGQTSSVTPHHRHNHATQHRSPESDLARPPSVFTKNERDGPLRRGFREEQENTRDSDGENISRSSDLLTEGIQAMCIQGFNTHYQQRLRRTQGGPIQTQQMSTSALASPNVLSNEKLGQLTEDIVERNKITLGRNTSKCGSYVTVHALKQEMPPNGNKVQVTQISKGKKGQWKEYPDPPQQQQPPARGVGAERGDRLSSPLARPAAVTQPKPRKKTSSQPWPPTIHLNISLNTSSHLLPLLQQKGQDAIISLASLHGCPHWRPASQVELALSPGYPQTNPGQSSQMSRKGVNAQLHRRKLESSPEQWQRSTASKWPSSCEGEDQKWSPNEVHSEQLPQNLPRTPTTTSSLGSGPYAVLPPIGNPVAGKEPKLSPVQSVNTAYPIHKSSSDGYLVQMEKQKQLRTRVTYKAYSLKDYRQLKSDINLRGLGPDYIAIEKTAEKMKRQRLYSNVIREQNKKISRIPFLLAKDPEGNDKKVPRIKALEYAKTIAKPPVQAQPKQRQKHRCEGFTEHASYLEGLDMFQPATLEVLRKRHEEEKQALALFGKVPAV